MVTLNGAAGKIAPSPEATSMVRPLAAGEGATATVVWTKFLWASNISRGGKSEKRGVRGWLWKFHVELAVAGRFGDQEVDCLHGFVSPSRVVNQGIARGDGRVGPERVREVGPCGFPAAPGREAGEDFAASDIARAAGFVGGGIDRCRVVQRGACRVERDFVGVARLVNALLDFFEPAHANRFGAHWFSSVRSPVTSPASLRSNFQWRGRGSATLNVMPFAFCSGVCARAGC